MQTQTTDIVPADFSIFIYPFSATSANSSAIIQNTTATPTDTNAKVISQSEFPDTDPPATITNLNINNWTQTTVTLGWLPPGDDGMYGNATGYVLKYSTSGTITDANWSSATTYSQSWTPTFPGGYFENGTWNPPVPESHVISGLSPDTHYWFAIKAYDNFSNYGNISNVASVTTRGPPAPNPGPNYGWVGPVVLVSIVVAVAVVAVALILKRRRA
jgi:hypothetical protein